MWGDLRGLGATGLAVPTNKGAQASNEKEQELLHFVWHARGVKDLLRSAAVQLVSNKSRPNFPPKLETITHSAYVSIFPWVFGIMMDRIIITKTNHITNDNREMIKMIDINTVHVKF